MGAVTEKTTHTSPSYDALSHNDQPITSLILRFLQSVEAQTEIPQPYQKPSDSHNDSMELCVEKPANNEREQQNNECLSTPDQADGRVCRLQ